ncbi:MAG: hypothetical protein ACR2QT_09985 [Woeseiaceae bacterium]
MKISTIWLVPLLSLVAACGGSSSSSSDGQHSAAVEQVSNPLGDSEIAALLYDNTYSAPNGFFVDERADTDRSYTLHHVLDESGSFELCTDDYAVAMAWEENDNATRSVQGYFVESYENNRYFEFARELSYENDVGNIEDITSPGFARVFKCRHTNRDGVDRSHLGGYAGTINAHPVDAESVQVFAEYLWQFTFFTNSRKKVIESVSSTSSDTLVHTLRLAFSTNQGTGMCDLIEVVDWRFSADRSSGIVQRSFDVTHTFEARYEAGSITICN